MLASSCREELVHPGGCLAASAGSGAEPQGRILHENPPKPSPYVNFRTSHRVITLINEIGQEYGVHPVQVGQWKKAIQEQAKTLFEGKRGPKPMAAHQEPELLYSEIGKLKMELDWLKKKSGISLP